MAAGQTTHGQRYPDVEGPGRPYERMRAGGYRRVRLGGERGWTWEICDPLGHAGRLGSHDVTEHEDGTITVSPSILDPEAGGWHGFLERGVWREV